MAENNNKNNININNNNTILLNEKAVKQKQNVRE